MTRVIRITHQILSDFGVPGLTSGYTYKKTNAVYSKWYISSSSFVPRKFSNLKRQMPVISLLLPAIANAHCDGERT